MTKELLKYFNGDDLASDVWTSKYQVKNNKGEAMETSPDDMHRRLAREFARAEFNNLPSDSPGDNLSEFGKTLQKELLKLTQVGLENFIYKLFEGFNHIVPQGSIMSILGHPYKTGSLSNCFVIPSPYDSYGGILRTDEQLVQLMKRRGGVGTNLNYLRPTKTVVSNAAGTSTGAPSFAERYSNSTREVAQDGRRGALMLLLSCLHPDIFNWTVMKKDRTKVTGANISGMFTDSFMKAAENNEDFLCRFPIDFDLENRDLPDIEYNKLTEISLPRSILSTKFEKVYIMKIKAKELFDLVIEMAWENAEPGVAFIDRIINYSPDGVYFRYMPIASNPCGEQWLQVYDSCRLLALNLFSVVVNPFSKDAFIDYGKLYELAYLQQRLADTLVDLEISYVRKIIAKVKADPEPIEAKRVELELWENILKTAQAGRRTGCGFTALADMLAAVNLKYDSEEGMAVIKKVCEVKMRAELDCSIDLAVLRKPFEGWDATEEFEINLTDDGEFDYMSGRNDFYQMIVEEFFEQAQRMAKYGRRNVSWSTVAPTGTVSIMTQTTSGLEPLFLAFYMRRKKINVNDPECRVDFVDQSGDKWQEFPVLHPKFKDWLIAIDVWREDLTKAELEEHFRHSPWFGSTANDINWANRVKIQSFIQRYTTNAISSTINLPSDVSKEEVSKIYWMAWRMGLKGVTVYRDGCRSGVLVSDSSKTKEVAFSQKDAAKRPKSLAGEGYIVTVKGQEYMVAIGLLNGKPYEVFATHNAWDVPRKFACDIIKGGRGKYELDIKDLMKIEEFNISITDEEAAVTRLISTALRHGTDIKFVVDQLNKTQGLIVGFTKAIVRVLKYYISEGEKSGVKCSECGGSNVIFKEGCNSCLDCGSSKCG